MMFYTPALKILQILARKRFHWQVYITSKVLTFDSAPVRSALMLPNSVCISLQAKSVHKNVLIYIFPIIFWRLVSLYGLMLTVILSGFES